MNSTTSVLYPQVTSIPSQRSESESLQKKGRASQEEFGRVFDQAMQKAQRKDALTSVQQPLKFSAHANQRIASRNIELGNEMMGRLNDAVAKANSKGIEDSLILTSDAAFIVNVPNKTVVTAMGRDQLDGNVFTNIDGAIVI